MKESGTCDQQEMEPLNAISELLIVQSYTLMQTWILLYVSAL